MRRLRLLLLLMVGAGTAGCADSVISVIQPKNDKTITVSGDSISYLVTDMENVTQTDTFTWNNPAERLTTIHESFLPHGYVLLVIFDAVGTVVDSTLLDVQLTTYSRAGCQARGPSCSSIAVPGGGPSSRWCPSWASRHRLRAAWHPSLRYGRITGAQRQAWALAAWAKEADEKRRGR